MIRVSFTEGKEVLELPRVPEAEFHELTGPYTKDGWSTQDPRMKWNVLDKGKDSGSFVFTGTAGDFLKTFQFDQDQGLTWEDEVLVGLKMISEQLIDLTDLLDEKLERINLTLTLINRADGVFMDRCEKAITKWEEQIDGSERAETPVQGSVEVDSDDDGLARSFA